VTTENTDRAQLAAAGVTEADMDEAMGPIVQQVIRMAKAEGRDPEEFLTTIEDALAPLALGRLEAQRAGLTGAAFYRTAQRVTAAALAHDGRDDLIPVAHALTARTTA
jgi:hypothetical protein